MTSQSPVTPLLFCKMSRRSKGLKTALLMCVFLGGTLLYRRRTSGRVEPRQSAEPGPGVADRALQSQRTSLQQAGRADLEVTLQDQSGLKTRDVSGAENPPFQLYVYELPAEFNRNIVSCVEEKMGGCFQLRSFGMGPEFARHGAVSFRHTHMFSLEVILHHKARYSPYRTLDPHTADAFYIPYYAGLACFCPHLQVSSLNQKLISHVTSRYPFLGRGQPHLMALGKIEREQWSKDCSILTLPQTKRIVFAGIEEEFSPALRAHFGRRGHPLIVAPYPAFGHFISSSSNKDVTSHMAWELGSRDVFVFLAASSRNAHRIRKALRPQFHATVRRYSQEDKRRDGWPVWLLTPECHGNWERKVVEWMRHSVFCVQPPGDSPTRKSFYDAVACGCVPVTFTLGHPVRYPFDKVLNYSDFTVIVDGKDVTERNITILDILRKIPAERIKMMQDNLKTVAHLLQYSYPSTVPSEDAFTMVMKEMARRVNTTKRSRIFHNKRLAQLRTSWKNDSCMDACG